jgi:hypothetical protein
MASAISFSSFPSSIEAMTDIILAPASGTPSGGPYNRGKEHCLRRNEHRILPG